MASWKDMVRPLRESIDFLITIDPRPEREHAKGAPRRASRAGAHSVGEVGVGPGADDAGRPLGLVAAGEQVVGALQGHEAARVPRRPEDLTRVRDAHGVVGRGVHHQQRPTQRADLLVQVRRAHVLDEVPPQGERLAADEEGCLAVGEDPFDEGVVGVLDMAGSYGAPMLATARTESSSWAAAMTAAPPKECPTSSRTSRPDSFMNRAACAVSAILWENDPSPQSPSESPSPRLSKRSIPMPSLASRLQSRLAAGLSLPSVKPWENTPQPRVGPSGWSIRPGKPGSARAGEPGPLGHVAHRPRA